MENFTPWTLFVDLGVISCLLLICKWMRVKLRLMQKFFIPPSLAAGFLGLAFGPGGMDVLPLSSQLGTYAGILIFAGLTAYDTQKIKNMLVAHGTEVNDSTMKLALLGSLDLYLDFINLFIYLLRIFGNKK